jgi:hypothetical protein
MSFSNKMVLLPHPARHTPLTARPIQAPPPPSPFPHPEGSGGEGDLLLHTCVHHVPPYLR